jgi:hypothetical protein
VSLTPEKIEQLKDAHGELRRVKTKRGDVVVRGPSVGEWRRWRAESADAKRRAQSIETLVRSCVVHPEPPAFGELLEKAPALVETLAEAVLELAGLEEDRAGEAL